VVGVADVDHLQREIVCVRWNQLIYIRWMPVDLQQLPCPPESGGRRNKTGAGFRISKKTLS